MSSKAPSQGKIGMILFIDSFKICAKVYIFSEIPCFYAGKLVDIAFSYVPFFLIKCILKDKINGRKHFLT